MTHKVDDPPHPRHDHEDDDPSHPHPYPHCKRRDPHTIEKNSGRKREKNWEEKEKNLRREKRKNETAEEDWEIQMGHRMKKKEKKRKY